MITLAAFAACAVLLGLAATRTPGRWARVFLVGLLTIILVVGFAAGWVDLLQGIATANMPTAFDETMGGAQQIARTQEVAGLCDDCHSLENNSPHGTEAISLSGEAPVVFIPLEISHASSGGGADEIVAYAQAPGPELKLVVSNWSEADFVETIRAGKTPGGHALDRRMPWRDIAAFAADDDLRAYYEYLKGQIQSDQ